MMNFRMLPPEEWNRLKSLSDELPDPSAVVFVLEDNDEIVAMRVVGQMVWAGGMVVHPDRRRQGLATTLNHSVENALRSVGVTGTIYMLPSNPESERTVESFGYERLPLAVYKKEI